MSFINPDVRLTSVWRYFKEENRLLIDDTHMLFALHPLVDKGYHEARETYDQRAKREASAFFQIRDLHLMTEAINSAVSQ